MKIYASRPPIAAETTLFPASPGRLLGQAVDDHRLQQPDGSASKDKARHDALTINGLKLTTVDLTGTYVAEVRPMIVVARLPDADSNSALNAEISPSFLTGPIPNPANEPCRTGIGAPAGLA